MKRFILSLLAGAMVFGAVLGSAAALGVDGGVLQAGEDTDLTCTDDVTVANYAPDMTDGLLYFARLDGLADCVGEKVVIRFDNGTGPFGIRAAATLEDGVVGASEQAVNLASSGPTPNVAGVITNGGSRDGLLRVNFPAGVTPESIVGLKVLIHSGS